MKKRREVLAILLAAVIFVGVTYSAAWLLIPTRTNYGSTWDSYLQEERDSIDVLFFGSSMAYCDVVPAIIWEETGLRSYVMAGPEQTIPITYYYLRETCKTQSPQAVVVELTGMFFKEFQNYTKANITYMPWSENRLLATLYAAEHEEQFGLLFPLYHYHDRVYSVSPAEIQQRLSPQADLMAGYTVLLAKAGQLNQAKRDFSADTDTYRNNLRYLEKISDFCAKQSIQLILYIAPAYHQIPDDALAVLKQDIAPLPHAAFFDCNDEPWLTEDPPEYWYDELHYNIYGAVLFSRRFGLRLMELDLEITGRNETLWQERLEAVSNFFPE